VGFLASSRLEKEALVEAILCIDSGKITEKSMNPLRHRTNGLHECVAFVVDQKQSELLAYADSCCSYEYQFALTLYTPKFYKKFLSSQTKPPQHLF
jgi:hypothetical protein